MVRPYQVLPTPTSFWITNVSKNIVCLNDLGVLIHPYQSMNLLDPGHHYITEDQIAHSLTTGSLRKYSHKIVVRKIPPPDPTLKKSSNIPLAENINFPSKIRSILEHKEEKYPELELTDDEYAKENAELAEIDNAAKFKKE
jgi:hypothetical protein